MKNWRKFLAAKLFSRNSPENNSEEIVLRNGVILNAPSHTDLSFLFHEIWIDKTYNPAGYEIAPGDVVVDIGANIGVFALYAATAAPRTRIHAFEPFPENADYLRQNIKNSRMTNIEVAEKAVARKADTRNLEVAESGITHTLSEQATVAGSVSVECTTLDEILHKFVKCDLLKIDCEGSEYEIFYSCSSSNLRKIQKIVGEYHYRNDSDENGKALKEYLESQSFRVDYFIPFDEQVGLICATNNS